MATNTPEHDSRRTDSGTTHPDVLAAYQYVECVKGTADSLISETYPMWYGWALREAFLAGITHAQQKQP